MSGQLEVRKEIINSLLFYLPNVSKSLNNLVIYIQNNLEGVSDREGTALLSIKKELVELLPSLKEMMNEVSPKLKMSRESTSDIFDTYLTCIETIVKGIEKMILWISESDSTDQRLRESIDALFLAGQLILDFVQILTTDPVE